MVELYHGVYHSFKVNNQSSLVYFKVPAFYSRDTSLVCLQNIYLGFCYCGDESWD